MSKPRVVAKANFRSKSERKRVRKGLIQGYLANKVADAKIQFRERQAFYRRLREIKLARRDIARDLHVLAELVADAQRAVRRLIDRAPRGEDTSMEEEALRLLLAARTSAEVIAGEYAAFARRRIYYVEAA